MRPVHLFDLDQVTRAVMGLPEAAQVTTVDQIITRAETADRFRKRLRRAHPRFGAGTLADAIDPPLPSARPTQCEPTYLAALSVVVARLLAVGQGNHEM